MAKKKVVRRGRPAATKKTAKAASARKAAARKPASAKKQPGPRKQAPARTSGGRRARGGAAGSVKTGRTPARQAAPASAPAGIAKAFVLSELKFAHDVLTKLIADIPEDQAQFQPAPSATHLLWQLGHLAVTYAWFRSSFDGGKVELPETYSALFGTGSSASPEPGVYPPLAEVRAAFDRAWDETIRAFESQTEEQLIGAPAIDTGGFAKTRMEIALHTVWHDGWHSGQLSAVRRALGLKPMWA